MAKECDHNCEVCDEHAHCRDAIARRHFKEVQGKLRKPKDNQKLDAVKTLSRNRLGNA